MILSQVTNPPLPNETSITFHEPNKNDIEWKLETDLANYDSLKVAPSQVFNIYVGLKQNDNLKKEVGRLKKVATDLNNTIQQQNSDYQQIFDQVMELNTQIQNKNDELVKKEGEIEKLKSKLKRFSVGPSVGISIDGKVYGGIGVNYAVFRF